MRHLTRLTLIFMVGLISTAIMAKEAIIDDYPFLAGKPVTLINILDQMEQKVGLKSIEQLPGESLYQVVSLGNEILYLSASGRYLISGGEVIDLHADTMLTQKKEQELSKIKWENMPAELAFTNGVEDSPYEIAIYTDVDCPYCRRLEKQLMFLSDIKITYYLNPLETLHPEAVSVSEKILCSDAPYKVMKDYMLNGVIPEAEVTDSCRDDVATLMAFARENNINSTPTGFLRNGIRLRSIPADHPEFKDLLSRAKIDAIENK